MGKLFFVGDSITAGMWDERGGWANRLELSDQVERFLLTEEFFRFHSEAS